MKERGKELKVIGIGRRGGGGCLVLGWILVWTGLGMASSFCYCLLSLIKGGSLAVMFVCRSVLGTRQWRLGFNACVVQVGLKIA
jgi:hypothetical protein